MPDELVPSADIRKAQQAMRAYAKRSEEILAAIIDYGRVLALGKKAYPKTNDFGEWITRHKLDLDSPWSDPRERSCAVKIYELAQQDPDFGNYRSQCRRSTPSNIMTEFRKFRDSEPESEAESETEKADGKTKKPSALDLANEEIDRLGRIIEELSRENAELHQKLADAYARIEDLERENAALKRRKLKPVPQ